MSSKEHCHGCGKLWSEESPDCVFNYHKKPEMTTDKINPEDIKILKLMRAYLHDLTPKFENCDPRILEKSLALTHLQNLIFSLTNDTDGIVGGMKNNPIESCINNDEIVSRLKELFFSDTQGLLLFYLEKLFYKMVNDKEPEYMTTQLHEFLEKVRELKSILDMEKKNE